MKRATGLVRFAAMAWATAIFFFSSVPGSAVPGRFGYWAHFIEYMVLGGLLYLAISGVIAERAILAISLASAYGVTDELHQNYVEMRTPDPLDWAMDTAGALVAVTLLVLLTKKLIPRQ